MFHHPVCEPCKPKAGLTIFVVFIPKEGLVSNWSIEDQKRRLVKLGPKKKILLSPVSRPTLQKGADPKNFAKKIFFFTFFIQKSF